MTAKTKNTLLLIAGVALILSNFYFRNWIGIIVGAYLIYVAINRQAKSR